MWSALAGLGMTRADHLVALGGGVVGDLAGFCAATYQRGVPVVQVPTSLVAQVDSAYGGKTGIDLAEAKNYVGAFHQPAGVLVDPGTLATLPPAELAAGYAEVLKTALIAGGTLWERIAADAPIDEGVILDCVRCKLAIVATDERDGGRRQVLNLGHTIGHAIETATGYARYRHGEAIGLGLLAALEVSGRGELREQVAALLAAHGLPTRTDGVDPGAVIAASARDKKRTGARVPFVVVDAPGRGAPRRRDRPRRPGGRRGGAVPMSPLRNRVAVMHGVNLDMLGRRDPRALRHAHARRARASASSRSGASSSSRSRCFQTNSEARVRRAPPPPAGPRGRHPAQPGRVDALLVGDPRRAGAHRASGRRGPPLEDRRARGLARDLRRARSRPRVRRGQGVEGYREALARLTKELDG